MLINFDYPLWTIMDQPYYISVNLQHPTFEQTDEKNPHKEILTLRTASVYALMQPMEKMHTEGKEEAFWLARKIARTRGKVELDANEVRFLKYVLGTFYGPGVVGPALAVIKGQNIPEKISSKDPEIIQKKNGNLNIVKKPPKPIIN